MTNRQTEKLVMAKEDYLLIIDYLENNKHQLEDDKNAQLLSRIEQAKVVSSEDFPWEVIRLNTRVIIRDKAGRQNYAYTVVLPGLADHKRCKVSLFSPIGSSLFGRRRGDDIYWQTLDGKRYFIIMAVSQFIH
ncbi:MAG TPA: GreA/GreB family elongation factor [Flavisolibacter sp.]|nr:GreA/GreB family elongation factor [Flavisolibacter sp.]